jgi:hypothetical protein
MNCPTHWRLRHIRYRLLGTRCVGCNQPVFPPRPLCPVCTGLVEARSPLTVLEAASDYPFGNMIVGSEGLLEVDLTVDCPDEFDMGAFS